MDSNYVYGAVPATLGRPVIVTDAPGLTDANGSATDTPTYSRASQPL